MLSTLFVEDGSLIDSRAHQVYLSIYLAGPGHVLPGFYMGSGDLNFSSHDWVAICLSLSHFPSLSVNGFIVPVEVWQAAFELQRSNVFDNGKTLLWQAGNYMCTYKDMHNRIG